MQRTRRTKKAEVRQRKTDRVDPLQELRQLKEDELRWATGGWGNGEYGMGDC